jgi:3-hydroxyisobutyrate dehydrogenase-like beta-hydroxyacid dehydrogenase
MLKIALIGHGEVGRVFREDFAGKAIVTAYDIRKERSLSPSLEDAIKGADIVFSCVTADQTEQAARDAGRFMTKAQVFFDLNSAAPETKKRASTHVPHYVEGAVMAPIFTPRCAVPTLAGGEKAVELAALLNPLGMKITPVSLVIGHASSMKLCRSIVIKGLEVLMVDCKLAAEKLGVANEVYASLDATYPSMNFKALAENMKERVETHGVRRSAEMKEAGDMLKDAGLNPDLAYEISKAQLRGVKV